MLQKRITKTKLLLLIITSVLILLFVNFKINTDIKVLEKKLIDLKRSPNYIKIEDISPIFLNAIISIEDRRFFEHNALDFKAILRALKTLYNSSDYIEGGSTITQQTVKNLCLNNKRNFKRKFEEVFLSYALEKTLSKKEILELYVNSIYFGNGYIGINSASKGYFKKLPRNLNYEEATLLAGVPQAPSKYALNKDSGLKLALKRQKYVKLALEHLDIKENFQKN